MPSSGPKQADDEEEECAFDYSAFVSQNRNNIINLLDVFIFQILQNKRSMHCTLIYLFAINNIN